MYNTILTQALILPVCAGGVSVVRAERADIVVSVLDVVTYSDEV